METIHQCTLCGEKINAFKVEAKDAVAISGGNAVVNQESLVTQVIFGGDKGKTVYTHILHKCPDGNIGFATLVGFKNPSTTHKAGSGLN